MKVGAYLLQKHNFGDEEVKSRFLDQFGYSERILESILDDRYQALLTCHLHDLSIFTGEDIEFLHSLEGYDQLSDFEKQTFTYPPMGKPCVSTPSIGMMNIKGVASLESVKVVNEMANGIIDDIQAGKPLEGPILDIAAIATSRRPFSTLPVKIEVTIKDPVSGNGNK